MQLPLEGDAYLFDRLAQGSLVDMGVSGMDGVDVNGGTSVAGLRPGRNYSVGVLIIKCAGGDTHTESSAPQLTRIIEFHRIKS